VIKIGTPLERWLDKHCLNVLLVLVHRYIGLVSTIILVIVPIAVFVKYEKQ